MQWWRNPTNLKIMIAAAASGLFAIPQLLVYYFNASVLAFAPEQIAFRFFLVARLAAGEGGAVWQPQGQLTSLIQRAIYSLEQVLVPGSSVFDQMDLMARIYAFIMAALFFAVLMVVAVMPRITVAHALLIAAVPFTIVHLLVAGLWYTSEPSYHQMNIFLFFVAAVFFVYVNNLRNDRNVYSLAAAFGIFLGLCAANKISLIFVGAPIAAVLLVDRFWQTGYRQLLIAPVIALLTTVAVAALIFLALYGFRLGAAAQAFAIVKGFTLNPGNPEPFLLHEFWNFANGYGYLHVALAFIFALALAVGFAWRRFRDLVILAVIVLTAAAYVATVFYRPAGHTVFDAACAFISLSVMALSLLPSQIVTPLRVVVSLGILAIALINWRPQFVDDIAKSREREDIRLEAWNYGQGIGAPIIAIVPDDRWATRGPLPVFIKGLGDVPSWDISFGPYASKILKAPLVVRSSGNTKTVLGLPYPPDATLMWEDVSTLPLVTEMDPELGKEIGGRECREWRADRGTLRICLPRNKR